MTKQIRFWMKTGSGYTGPGIERGRICASEGSLRIIVGHKILGGQGEFLHIYAFNQLQEITEHKYLEMTGLSYVKHPEDI